MTVRSRTLDKESTAFHVVEQIGPKRSKTPEGFLLCEAVAIARCGTMTYGPGETPVKTGNAGIAFVTRDADALFDPVTVASFNGKPVVNEHPLDDVCPSNWRQLSIGVVLNPRRGEGDDSDVILADLLITDAAAIRDIDAGKRDVSAGYEADYEQTGDGEGKQTNIIGNHVALVDRGRCGPRCAIGDHQTSTKEPKMATRAAPQRKQVPDAVRQYFRDRARQAALDAMGDVADGDGATMAEDDPYQDGAAAPAVTAGDDDNHIHIHMHGADATPAPAPAADMGAAPEQSELAARIGALEATVQQLLEMIQGPAIDESMGTAPPAAAEGEAEADPAAAEAEAGMPDEDDPSAPTKDRMTVGDSAALATAFQKLVSDAEILVPGFRMPTFDAAVTRRKTVDTMCAVRKRVLGHMCATSEGSKLVAQVDAAFSPVSADCAQAASMFSAVAALRKTMNNAAATTRDSQPDAKPARPGPTSLAELNALYRKHYAGK